MRLCLPPYLQDALDFTTATLNTSLKLSCFLGMRRLVRTGKTYNCRINFVGAAVGGGLPRMITHRSFLRSRLSVQYFELRPTGYMWPIEEKKNTLLAHADLTEIG